MAGRFHSALLIAGALFAGALALDPAGAQDAKGKGKPAGFRAKGKKPEPAAKGAPGKPVLVATSGDWTVYVAQGGKDRTCYALSQPKDRQPSTLKRDPAFVFISTRPAENVKNEVSVIMGFPLKDGGDASAEIGDNSFDLVARGTSAWIKNAAEEGQFIDALKKGGRLVVKAPSAKGNVTTDSYSLSGLSQALEQVAKKCAEAKPS